MRWTYEIEGVQVYPMNTRSLEIKETLSEGFIYAYRKSLNGEIILMDNQSLVRLDYTYIKTLESNYPYEKFTFKIYNNGLEHFKGEFSINDCEFDTHKSTVKIKISPRDVYTEIQELEDVQVNIIGTKYNVTADVHSYIALELKTRADITPFTDPADETYRKLLLWHTPVITNNLDEYVYWALYATELFIIKKNEAFDTTGWNLYVTLDDYYIYRRFPTLFVPTCQKITSDDPAIPSTVELVWSIDGEMTSEDTSDWNYTKLVPQYNIQSWILDDYHTQLYKESGIYLRKSYYNGRFNNILSRDYTSYKLKDSLEKILSTMGFTYQVRSGVLFNDPCETGRSYPSGYSSLVTTHDRYLIEMSDFRKPNAYEEATKAIITWKQLSEYLCQKHNLMWFIDGDEYVRFEHVSYEDNEVTLDKSEDTNLTRKYTYLQNDKPNRMYMTEALAYNEDFGQIEVLFGTVPALEGIKENTKTISLSTIYTDVDGLNTHLDEIPDEGFVYVDAFGGSVFKDTGFKSSEVSLQNAALSNANCLNTFYRHKTYQQDFSIGGRAVTAESIKRMKKQELEFTGEENPDPTKMIVTRIGTAEFKELSYPTVEEYKFKAEVYE